MKGTAFALSLLAICFNACNTSTGNGNNTPADGASPYLNHGDSAKYVGMTACRSCHQDIYNTFIQTGMGKSFDLASAGKSAADFSKAGVYDHYSGYHYHAFLRDDSLFVSETLVDNNDTLHRRTEAVNYIIGSGQHTNSHLYSVNGYLYQMPMTYYTQKKTWDLPPGFESGVNTRFSRKIGLECMTCHNAFPDFVKGSENKFRAVPRGIDCERCHGPGSIHVAQRSTGSRVDTSQTADYSIVNPARLPMEAQFDICQRCHLQGNAVLKANKSFYDFRPGMKLSDYISVFLPKYSNSEEEFIMASHADRLKQSPCFMSSNAPREKGEKRPALTCTTCHNPHVSVRETNAGVFNEACLNCHGGSAPEKARLQDLHREMKDAGNCVSCHMPVSGSSDIPHVTIHDHFIRKPVSAGEKKKIRDFLGLYSVNESHPDDFTLAKAYISQYEKFEQESYYLDSAMRILQRSGDQRRNIHALVQVHFIRKDYQAVIALVEKFGESTCLNEIFTRSTYENEDAWTCYRVAESVYHAGQLPRALTWFEKAVLLAPYNLEFRSKLGTTQAALNLFNEAVATFEFILAENRKFTAAYTNLGYIRLVTGFPAEAIRLYREGEKLDPGNESLLLNLAGYYSYTKNKNQALKYLERVLKLNPQNARAQAAIKQMKSNE